MPSPESPTNRTVIPLTNSTGFSIVEDAWVDIFQWLILLEAIRADSAGCIDSSGEKSEAILAKLRSVEYVK
jgi:hypothetical protein